MAWEIFAVVHRLSSRAAGVACGNLSFLTKGLNAHPPHCKADS